MWGWLATSALAGAWTVDAVSLDAPGSWPVTTHTRCPEPAPDAPRLGGRPLTTLGVAAVIYSRKQATMAWGHASLRATYCLGDEVVDVEYESYRLSAWNEAQLRHEHAGEAFLEGDWIRGQRGALVLFRNRDPVDGGWFADAQRHNREIYELWLDLDQAELDRIVLEADAAYEAQRERLRARQDLPMRYRALSTNCTWVLQRWLPDALTDGEDPHLPFAWLRALEPSAARQVLHPSVHLVRRWGELPDQVDKPSPVFRRGRARRDASR